MLRLDETYVQRVFSVHGASPSVVLMEKLRVGDEFVQDGIRWRLDIEQTRFDALEYTDRCIIDNAWYFVAKDGFAIPCMPPDEHFGELDSKEKRKIPPDQIVRSLVQQHIAAT